MVAYLILLAMLLIIVPYIVYRVILSKRKPPYIEKNDGCDTVSVYVWSRAMRMPYEYREYVFVRRKNGGYGMKFRIYDVVCMVVPTFQLSLFTFIIYCFKDEFIKNPDTIPALAAFFLWFIFLVVFSNYSQAEARIFFSKNVDMLN